MPALLLDLDGTFIDTAPDMVAVLNTLCEELGRPPVPYARARNQVSNGAVGLIRLALGPDLPETKLEPLRLRYLELYESSLCIKSQVFSGLRELVEQLDEKAVPWGIVTNKPAFLTEPLLAQLGLAPGVVVSGDSLPQRKPDPAPLLAAAKAIEIDAKDCIYVGDAPRDIEAGRAAGMTTLAAAYGYVDLRERIAAWRSDGIIGHSVDLRRALATIWPDAIHEAA